MHWVNCLFSCSDTGKTIVPQAISFGKQTVEEGSSFNQRASSVTKHSFRDDHILKIPTVLKARNDMPLPTDKRTKQFLGRPAAHWAEVDE